MKIKVLFFAQFRDLLGAAERSVEAEEGTTAGNLVKSLLEESGKSKYHELPVLYAINENFEKAETVLRDQDVLAVLPPVSGG
ncbi:MAG: MoaD/ThiS family protein [Candidatus Omnitrophota bacterium]|nr:MoaD/ThiS family protein [Candidatus Omnitrophota bacterium]